MKRNERNLLIAIFVSLSLFACKTVEKEGDVAEPTADVPIEEPIQPAEDLPIDIEEESASEVVAKAAPAKRVKIARSIVSQAERYEALAMRFEDEKEWHVTNEKRTLILNEESRKAKLDGVNLYLDRPFLSNKGRWLLSESDERIVLQGAFGKSDSGPREIKTIVIDPGHGGAEDGTKNESLGMLEKDLNLEVSERLKTHLDEMGYKTVLTRYEDRLVPLKERPELANQAGAELFISIHFNASLNKEANGLETYMLTPEGQPSTTSQYAGPDAVAFFSNQYDSENFELAYRIQKALVSSLQREDRGVRKARFAVLKTVGCPGILVECGFLSHGEEALLVSTPVYREKVALSLSKAIESYIRNAPYEEL